MLNIEFQELAHENLDFIFSYIAENDKIIAIKVIQKINNTIKNLELFPYMWKPTIWRLREIIEPKYKFRIIYYLNEEEKTITIISIFKNKNNF